MTHRARATAAAADIRKIQRNASALDIVLAKCLRLTPRAYVKIDKVCGSRQKRVDAHCPCLCLWMFVSVCICVYMYVCVVQFQVTEKKRQDMAGGSETDGGGIKTRENTFLTHHETEGKMAKQIV